MSTRVKRSGKSIFIGILLIAAAAVWIISRFVSSEVSGISGENDKERVAFIESFGWDARNVPNKIEEIRIPVNFDEVYEEYNALQLEQGFDLRKYRAYYAKKYSYEIKNYDGSDPAVPICANLLVIDGKIVGADISSAESGGFVTVLAKK